MLLKFAIVPVMVWNKAPEFSIFTLMYIIIMINKYAMCFNPILAFLFSYLIFNIVLRLSPVFVVPL